jgi:hypothetical protein
VAIHYGLRRLWRVSLTICISGPVIVLIAFGGGVWSHIYGALASDIFGVLGVVGVICFMIGLALTLITWVIRGFLAREGE